MVAKGSISPTQIDITRERELFRYFRPPDERAVSSKATRHHLSVVPEDALNASTPSSPETTLTALAQLCALRLNASRAMVRYIRYRRVRRRETDDFRSVIGKETQYFIAEATKTLDLDDTRKSENEDDGLWLGCASVGKEGRLCEVTSH